MLPDYIPMRLGESILFAGKAIRVLRNPSPAFQFQKDKNFQQTMRGSQRIRGFMHSDFPERETELDADLKGEELLPQSEADKIEIMLKDLKVLVGTLSHAHHIFGRKCINRVNSVDLLFDHGTCDLSIHA